VAQKVVLGGYFLCALAQRFAEQNPKLNTKVQT